MTARGFSPSYVGAPSMDDLEEAGVVRCEKCRQPCEETELEDGRCAECRPMGELTTEQELRP